MLEEIKKFKNGKIKMQVPKNSIYYNENGVDENFYHNEMFMSDLYFNQINGYMYLIDFNKSIAYEIGSYLLQNPIKYILEELTNKKVLYLYPLTKKYSRSLLMDLENGY